LRCGRDRKSSEYCSLRRIARHRATNVFSRVSRGGKWFGNPVRDVPFIETQPHTIPPFVFQRGGAAHAFGPYPHTSRRPAEKQRGNFGGGRGSINGSPLTGLKAGARCPYPFRVGGRVKPRNARKEDRDKPRNTRNTRKKNRNSGFLRCGNGGEMFGILRSQRDCG
jgi:hypothetical protein